jgi:hypothetical protein
VIVAVIALARQVMAAERQARRAVRARVERSRLTRSAGVVVAVAASALLADGWLHPPHLAIAAALYALLAAVVEWRRQPARSER